ncbi:acyl carrier protein [Sphingomonas histidinilytica]|uniref:Phosphopantetheine attachment site n=1 Tax=Rhizorhabdus histidinilytica TaxID=439228 RepID=A0A1T5B5B8_9SPHN|nr:phosphopantetheine-binding protein [Rhizorhabdus histidinilytica]MBO9376505.1 acyl carrier protein [Rhizorhabdus histidinilytica]QEH79365.1 acyl carrier protein [Sphingomonas sp. C8-2]SKB42454.1 Phosphopantetheine attachment site [Rhizorhabdus histidinilytica]
MGAADFDQTEDVVRAVLVEVLALDADRAAGFTADTGLFGSLPELDSMAVAGLLTALEDRLDIIIDDDEVDGEMLESFGALVAFVDRKLAGK